MSLKIEIVSVNQLSPDSRNARKHSDANISAIAGSLRQFGQRKPIVVTAENVVIAGNGTLEAAKSLGWSDIAIVRIPNDWSSNQIMAFALADNRTAELAEWDVSVLDDELQELIFAGFDVEDFGFAQAEVPPENDWSGLGDAVKDRSGMQHFRRSGCDCPGGIACFQIIGRI